MQKTNIRIGGASGFWGDAARSTPQLLACENLDYIVYDYLAEITMSIMARARAKDAAKGYALDFVHEAMAKNLAEISKQGVKIISNAGGVNPQACVEALNAVIEKQGLNLKVACVLGDDLLGTAEQLAAEGHTEMFSGTAFPQVDKVLSVNAYLGAFPIAKALELGADIVVTGRSVDSAVTLGACIHAFGWSQEQLDQLAMGSLAGHILECGPQATGGNFTDWHLVSDRIHEIGYPIAEVESNGVFTCSKPESTGGMVSLGTVAEQLLYEIGDPQSYLLPDVSCDFSQVTITEVGENKVRLEGAKGHFVPNSYKVCVTYADQFRGGTQLTFFGRDAEQKATALSSAVFKACRRSFDQIGLNDFSETSIELLGAESQYGDYAQVSDVRELVMKIAAKHDSAAGIGILLREITGLALATPPGLSGFQGARPKPSPVIRLFSFALTKANIPVSILLDGQQHLFVGTQQESESGQEVTRPALPELPDSNEKMLNVALIDLAWGRSGDKGNKANVGIIARKPEFYPYIVAALSEESVAKRYAHFMIGGEQGKIDRYLLPGLHGLNFLMHEALGGGGVASIRNDAQGKGYAQLLLEHPISIPESMASGL